MRAAFLSVFVEGSNVHLPVVLYSILMNEESGVKEGSLLLTLGRKGHIRLPSLSIGKGYSCGYF